MTIYNAFYMSGMNYPNEWRFLGNFSSEEAAEKYIKSNIDTDKFCYPEFPARYEQKRECYDIIETTLDEGYSFV